MSLGHAEPSPLAKTTPSQYGKACVDGPSGLESRPVPLQSPLSQTGKDISIPFTGIPVIPSLYKLFFKEKKIKKK
jgi:hypothetical protein